jgi:hypothetical protein
MAMMFLPRYFLPVGSGILVGILVGWVVCQWARTGKLTILSGSLGGAVGAIGGLIVRGIYAASLPQGRRDEWGFSAPDPPITLPISWGIILVGALLGSLLLASMAAFVAKWRRAAQNRD